MNWKISACSVRTGYLKGRGNKKLDLVLTSLCTRTIPDSLEMFTDTSVNDLTGPRKEGWYLFLRNPRGMEPGSITLDCTKCTAIEKRGLQRPSEDSGNNRSLSSFLPRICRNLSCPASFADLSRILWHTSGLYNRQIYP